MPYSIYHSVLFTLLHSIWQLGLSYLVYKVFIFPASDKDPAQRKNILFFLLGFQVILSVFTFISLNSSALSAYSFSSLILDLALSDAVYKNLFYSYCSLIAARALFISWRFRQQKNCIVNHLIPVPSEIMVTLNKLTTQISLSKKISCWCHTHITTPVVYGFLKPVIIFPVAALNTLSLQETEALLLHELAHIKYNDHLLNLLLIIQETIFFFNPFMWLIAKDIRHEREKACDVFVINNGCERTMYASALYKVSVPFQSLQWSLAATGKKKKLLQRIQFFTQVVPQQKSKKNFSPFISSFLCLLLVCSVLFTKNQDFNTQNEAVQISTNLLHAPKNVVAKNEALPVIKSEMLIDGFTPVEPKLLTNANSTFKEIEPVLKNVLLPTIKINQEIKLPVYNVSYTEGISNSTHIVYLEEENNTGSKTVTLITVQQTGENINVTPVLKVERFPLAFDSFKLKTSSDTGKVFIYH